MPTFRGAHGVGKIIKNKKGEALETHRAKGLGGRTTTLRRRKKMMLAVPKTSPISGNVAEKDTTCE